MKIKPKLLITNMIFLLVELILLKCAMHFFLRPLSIRDTKKHMSDYGRQAIKVLEKGGDINQTVREAWNRYNIYVGTSRTEDQEADFEGNPPLFMSETERNVFLRTMDHCPIGKELFYFTGHEKSPEWKIFYIFRPLKDRYVFMAKGLGGMVTSTRIITHFSFYAVCLFALGALIFGMALTNNFVERLNFMCRITDKMAHLEFDEKLMFSSHDEIGMLASSIDTMSDELRENLGEMKEELQRRKTLVRNVAHDIRTPLTVIRGYAEGIKVMADGQEKIPRYSDIIVDECDRLNAMTNGLLALNSVSNAALYYKKEPCDTGELFQGIQSRLEVMGQEKAVRCEYDRRVIWIVRDLIEYALFNMIDNAVKYGDPGKPILVTGKEEPEGYFFTVRNSGEPMSDKDIKYIWDALYKADHSRKRGRGYGIGLAIVKQMALFHEGTVRAWSRDGYNYFSFSVSLKGAETDETDQVSEKEEARELD